MVSVALVSSPNLRISEIAFEAGLPVPISIQSIFPAHRRCFTERIQDLKRFKFCS